MAFVDIILMAVLAMSVIIGVNMIPMLFTLLFFSQQPSVRDRDAEDCAAAERSFVAALGGGCALPVAAYVVAEAH